MVRAARVSGARKDLPKKTSKVIAAPTAPGASYVQAEAASMKTAVDNIRTALIDAGITKLS